MHLATVESKPLLNNDIISCTTVALTKRVEKNSVMAEEMESEGGTMTPLRAERKERSPTSSRISKTKRSSKLCKKKMLIYPVDSSLN